MINFEFKSVIELVKAFPRQDICIKHLEELRWNGNVVSPFDASSKVYVCKDNKYKCKNTGKYFNVMTATLFDNTKIELPTWFLAIYLITGHKKDISSIQLSKDLNVTQKTAWFMNHRIRACFGLEEETEDNNNKMGGEGVVVEVDETIIGGKVKNMSNKKRKHIAANQSAKKTIVLGIVERSSNVRLQVVKSGGYTPDLVRANVDNGSLIMTDTANTFVTVGNEYAHHGTVDHSKKEYGRGVYFTNTMEGAFSQLDRMVIGTYHWMSPKHMQKYLNDFCFRYNSRNSTDSSRFKLMLSNMENRLTYKSLIA